MRVPHPLDERVVNGNLPSPLIRPRRGDCRRNPARPKGREGCLWKTPRGGSYGFCLGLVFGFGFGLAVAVTWKVAEPINGPYLAASRAPNPGQTYQV